MNFDPSNASPAEVVQAMLQKAVDNKSFRELGTSLEKVQENVDTVFGVWQQHAGRTTTAITQLQIGMESLRYAIGSIVDLLVEHKLITEEEVTASRSAPLLRVEEYREQLLRKIFGGS